MSAGELTQGTRCPNAVLGVKGGGWDDWENSVAGAYMLVNVGAPDGPEKWNLWIKDPRGHIGMCASHIHTITINDDDTITVSPSIAPNDANPGGWHGYLEHGVWREV